MKWLQVTLNVSQAKLKHCETSLEALGALAVTIENAGHTPIFELPDTPSPLWNDNQVTGLFTADANPEELSKALARKLKIGSRQIKIQPLADEPWERSWMARYHPIQISENIWIVPSWQEAPNPKALNIILDPGLAFGTGTHPTTKLCLEWLAKNPPLKQTIVDYGCGSGILSIAAMMLGANTAYAIDIEQEALKTSFNNAKTNAVNLNHYHCLLPQNAASSYNADLVLANILAKPLQSLAPTLTDLLKPQGKIVLSGILSNQTQDILSVYQAWFTDFEIIEEGEWCRITGTKK